MLIRVTSPRGLAPSVNPAVLADAMAQSAVNCVLGMGVISPLRATTVVAAATKAGEIKSIFPFAGKWLNWIDETAVCRNTIANDDWNRVYFADGVQPKYTVPDIATAGNDYPAVSYDLGIPAPTLAPNVAAAGDITDDDQTLVISRSYVVTYVSAYGEEGPPSPPSLLVDVAPGQTVDVTGLGVAPSGAFNIILKRIYRTNTGTSGTEFQLVATIDVAAVDYSDAIESVSLGAVIPSVTWEPPPADLHHMITLPCGALAGLSGNELCFSEPYMPHAWPPEYRLSFDFKGTALGAFGNNIMVATEGVPYLVAGSHPEMMSPERLEMGHACVAGRGMVDMGYAVIYPTVDGLMLAGMGDVRLLTKGLIDQRDWAALKPETIHAYLWDDKYVAFWTNDTGSGGFIFDPASGDLTYHVVEATAGYHDPLTGELYLCGPTGNIVSWNSGGLLLALWKSKRFMLPYPTNLSCGQVVADSYPLTAKFFADDALVHTQAVAGSDPFRLPGGFRALSYEIAVETTAEVTLMALASSMQELTSL